MAEFLAGYAFRVLEPVARDAPRSLEPRTLPDVVAAFDRLNTRGDDIGAHAPDGAFPPHRYTSVAQHENRGFIHFQGFQRLRHGRYAVVSGGDSIQPAAHMFVVEMASRYVRGPWGSNLVRSTLPPEEDRVVQALALDPVHWHAGGFSMLGDVAVVPLEHNGDPSSTIFVDFSDPLVPRPLPIRITGRSNKAGAAALTRLPGGRFLCAIYRDEKVPKQQPTGFFDFYLSRTTDLCDGFPDEPFATVHYADVENRQGRRPGYQTVQFLVEGDPDDAANWALYLGGTWNGSSMSPTLPGPDWADLHLVTLDTRIFRAEPPAQLLPPHLRLVRSREFTCRDCFGNFDAAAGFHTDASGRLAIYSSYHWRFDGAMLIAEFREAVPADAPPIEQIHDAWIDLFEHPGYHGRRLSILGTKEEAIRSYAHIAVQGGTFNRVVSSARWQIPAGRMYRLYADADYREDAGTLDLEGDGNVREIPDFRSIRPKFDNRTSSSRYV